MHGYELKRAAHDSRIDAWSGVLAGSIYHALKTLEREGLIAATRESKRAARPRVVYSITPAGRRALKGLVRQALDAPVRGFPTDLYGALMHLGAVSAGEKNAAITRQIHALEAEIADWAAAKPNKLGAAPEAALLFDNALDHMRMNLTLLKRLQSRRQRRVGR